MDDGDSTDETNPNLLYILIMARRSLYLRM